MRWQGEQVEYVVGGLEAADPCPRVDDVLRRRGVDARRRDDGIRRDVVEVDQPAVRIALALVDVGATYLQSDRLFGVTFGEAAGGPPLASVAADHVHLEHVVSDD